MNRSLVSLCLIAVLVVAAGCGDGASAVLSGPVSKVWMTIAPAQCGPTAWEAAGQTVASYYSGLGVTIHESESGRLDPPVFCESCACPRGDTIDVLIDGSQVAALEGDGFMLRSAFGDVDCPSVAAKFEVERDRVQGCATDNECGRVLTGTSCGCTHDLVARRDAEPERFLQLISEAARGTCDLPLAAVDACDCPEADGFACVQGSCDWNYAAAP